MRFLADENVPRSAVAALADAGHDVEAAKEILPGGSDAALLRRAIRDRRILLTFDKDFGELAGKAALPPEAGVILFRIIMPKAAETGAILAALIASRDDWAGHFSVVEPGRVRMRRLR